MRVLGNIFFQRRAERQQSRAAVAYEMSQALGERVDQTYIANLENGRIGRPPRARLRWMAQYFEVPVSDAFGAAGYSMEGEEAAAGGFEQLPLDVREAVRGLDTIPTEQREEVLDLIRRVVRLYLRRDAGEDRS